MICPPFHRSGRWMSRTFSWPRLHLSRGRARLVLAPRVVEAGVDHDESGVLHRGAGGSAAVPRQARDLQYRRRSLSTLPAFVEVLMRDGSDDWHCRQGHGPSDEGQPADRPSEARDLISARNRMRARQHGRASRRHRVIIKTITPPIGPARDAARITRKWPGSIAMTPYEITSIMRSSYLHLLSI